MLFPACQLLKSFLRFLNCSKRMTKQPLFVEFKNNQLHRVCLYWFSATVTI